MFFRYFPKFLIVSIFAILMVNVNTYAQSFDTDFGKNRVQYHNSIWSSYESENAIVYFYQGGQSIARYALQYIERELPNIGNVIEHSLSQKVQVMVYHNQADVIQSNIGIGLTRSNQGGITEILGNKIFVYYKGNYNDLEKQLREGITKAHIDHIVFGSSVQEILQNAVLLELPDWYSNGIVAYVAEPWSSEKEAELYRSLRKKSLKNFNKLWPEESTLAGHALWHYIADTYGEASISNILYVTRVNRSVDAGFRFVTGKDSKALIDEWRKDVLETKAYDAVVRDSIELGQEEKIYKTKRRFKKASINDFKVSPDGKFIAYSHSDNGLLRVFLYDVEKNKHKKIEKAKFKTYELPKEENYPLLAWDKRSKFLAVVYEKRDLIRLEIHNLEENTVEKKEITKFQQVTGITFTNNSRRLVVSAVRNGISDLYLYNIPNTKTTRLTNDAYDDLQPRFGEIEGQEGIFFISNRPDDVLETLKMDSLLSQQLPFNDFDVFFYQFDNEKQSLVQITDTEFGNEKQPLATSDSTYAYLSDDNGIYNVYSGKFESVFVKKDTIITYKDSIITNPQYAINPNDSLIQNIAYEDVYKRIGNTWANTNEQRSIEFWDYALKAKEVFSTKKGWKQYPFNKSFGTKLLNTKYEELDRTPYFKVLAAQKRIEGFSISKSITKINEQAKANTIDEEIIESKGDTIETIVEAPYLYQSDLDYWDLSDTENIEDQMFDNTAGADTTNTNKPNLVVRGNEFNPNLLYRKSKARVYKPQFAIDYIASQLDSPQPQFYQTTGTLFNQINNIPETASNTFNDNSGDSQMATFKMGVSDLFEDYKIIGTLKVPVSNFSSYLVSVEFQNLKKRLDRKWMIQRRKDVEFIQGFPIEGFPNVLSFANKKIISTIFQSTLVYPIDITRSIRLKTAVRNDKHVPLTETREFLYSIYFTPTSENIASTKLEYVFDNTINIGVNLIEGLRYKFYAEINKPFEATVNDSELSFSAKNTGYIGVAGFDIRHYYKVHRKIIWANRLASGFSFGPKRIMYYLGGVDGWLIPSFNNNTPVNAPENGEYVLQSSAPNLRGFQYNVRNGSKYAVFNSELRVPIFSYLFNRPLKSQFIRDFQTIGFFDAGTAWENGSPFSEENRFYTYNFPENPNPNDAVNTSVQYFKNPIVYSYGLGLRSTLLGYYIRLDIGWGVDSGYRSSPLWHLSLGYDF